MPRILILDTVYPEVIKAIPINPAGTYESELAAFLYHSFGTFDAYSRNLAALGWEAEDVIANHAQLNALAPPYTNAPDVLFLQDLSLDIPQVLSRAKIVAGQLSCPWPGDDNVRKCAVIFTSFPHYVARIEALGVKAVYNPLAFDPIVIERCGVQRKYREYANAGDSTVTTEALVPERIYDCTFVGGVGAPGHWRQGMDVLNAVAEAIPTFKWWGYGADLLPSNSALRQKYQGEAWGLDMYRIYLQSKIVLNRHGEVAEGFANNMRMFEATGCGALLATEYAPNLGEFFNPAIDLIAYKYPEHAVQSIRYALSHWPDVKARAVSGQWQTLEKHTYAKRMQTVSDTLLVML